MADWKKIKAEYIAGGISYRRLAEKSGVSFNTLKTIAIKEKWAELRQQADHKATTVMVETIGEANGNTAVKVNDVADKLLEEIGSILDENKGRCDPKTIKDLATALKSIKDVKGEQDEGDSECGVIFMPPIKAKLRPPEETEDE